MHILPTWLTSSCSFHRPLTHVGSHLGGCMHSFHFYGWQASSQPTSFAGWVCFRTWCLTTSNTMGFGCKPGGSSTSADTSAIGVSCMMRDSTWRAPCAMLRSKARVVVATAGVCGNTSTSQKVFVVHIFCDMTRAVNAWGEWRSFILCDNHVLAAHA